MNAMDVMERNVVTIGPEATVAEAAKLMTQHDVSALPVVDADNQLVGIISEADLIRREEIGTQADHSWWIEAMIPAATLAAEFAKSQGAYRHCGRRARRRRRRRRDDSCVLNTVVTQVLWNEVVGP